MALLKERSIKTLLTDLKDWFALKAKTVFSVNGHEPVDGAVNFDTIPYADNLTSDETQHTEGSFLARTTGGEISLSDGDSFVQRILGNRVHEGYVAEVLTPTVIAMPRPTPAAITATLNETTFEEYVGEAGTYTLSFTGGDWSADPALYGVTVTNDPVNGDQIVITWDGDTPEQAITLYLNVTRDIARELDITPEQARLLTDTCVTRRGDTYKATVGTITDTSKSVKGALGNLHGTLRPAIQTAVTTLHLTPWDVWHAAIGTRIIEHTDKTDTRHVLLGDAIGEGADTPATIMDAIHLNDPNPAHTLADKLGTTIEHAADMLSHVERPEDAGDDFAYGMRIIEPPLNEPRWIRGHGRTPMLAVLDAKRIADNAKPPIA